MGQLQHRIDELEKTAEKEEIALEKRLKTAVVSGNRSIEGGLMNAVSSLADARARHTESSTKNLVTELAKVSPPILKMIVDSHNALLGRVETLETKLAEKQVKSQSELLNLLGSATKKLEKIENRKFPSLKLGSVDNGLKMASIELAGAVALITEKISSQDAKIKAIQTSVDRKLVVDFDIIREGSSDLLKKVIATERT